VADQRACPGLAEFEGFLKPRRRLVELAVEHASKCNEPRKPHGLEGLIEGWRGAQAKLIVLSPKIREGTPSSPTDGFAQLLQRVVVADGARERLHDAENVVVERDSSQGDALGSPWRIRIRERLEIRVLVS